MKGFHWRSQSLARRLAITYLLTTPLIVIALSVTVYLSTAFYLNEQLDTELASQADFYAAYAANLASDERALTGLAKVSPRELAAPESTCEASRPTNSRKPPKLSLKGELITASK